MANPCILVIEDNRDNMTLIVDVLRSLDYDVLEATDGEKGIDLARHKTPDLILLDLSLPRIDGWAVARQIRNDPASSLIPIIALTAHAMVGDRERAIEAGCNDYISKPINLQELVGKLNQYVN